MSQYYNPFKSSRGLFNPDANEPFQLSRSKIDLFVECPRCFYFDRRIGIGRPPGFPFSLNAAVDMLLKKEFDYHRANKTPHPFMKHYSIDAVPFAHPDIDAWRDSLRRGIIYIDPVTNLKISGGVDDVWIGSDKKLIIADYKATAKASEVNLDAEWQDGYKRQMEVYQWLFRKNAFDVSDTGYFVYVNGKLDAEVFDSKLEFDVKLIPYKGDTSWIEPKLKEIKKCLMENTPPKDSSNCDYCAYFYAREQNEPKEVSTPKKVGKKIKTSKTGLGI